MSDTFLSKEDMVTLTGAKTKSKQIAQLRKMGLLFWVNALGVPVVPRSAIDGRATTAPTVKPEWVPPGMRRQQDGK